MPMPIGFRPLTIEKLLESAEREGVKIDKRKGLEIKLNEFVKFVFNRIGTLNGTARYFGISQTVVDRVMDSQRYRTRIEKRQSDRAEKIAEQKRLKATVRGLKKHCQCCGVELPKKPVRINGCILTRTCVYCWQAQCNQEPEPNQMSRFTTSSEWRVSL